MKRLIAIILILVMLVPAAALAEDYSPALGMNKEEFFLKYNAISAPLGSPYNKIEKSYHLSANGVYTYFWFKPAQNSSVVLFLATKDSDFSNYGIDMIQIGTNNKDDFIDLISIAARCSDIFASDILGTKLSAYRVGEVIRYYYENGCKSSGLYAYNGLDNDGVYLLSFFESEGWYYFQISTLEGLQ